MANYALGFDTNDGIDSLMVHNLECIGQVRMVREKSLVLDNVIFFDGNVVDNKPLLYKEQIILFTTQQSNSTGYFHGSIGNKKYNQARTNMYYPVTHNNWFHIENTTEIDRYKLGIVLDNKLILGIYKLPNVCYILSIPGDNIQQGTIVHYNTTDICFIYSLVSQLNYIFNKWYKFNYWFNIDFTYKSSNTNISNYLNDKYNTWCQEEWKSIKCNINTEIFVFFMWF